MQIRLRSLLTFYRSFFSFSIFIDAICFFVIVETHFNLFMMMFWFKVVAMLIIFYFISEYKRREFYYYRNMGISKAFLWRGTLSVDFLLFLLGSFLIYTLK